MGKVNSLGGPKFVKTQRVAPPLPPPPSATENLQRQTEEELSTQLFSRRTCSIHRLLRLKSQAPSLHTLAGDSKMMTPLFTPLKGEGATPSPAPPLAPLDPGGERPAAGERASPPPSGPREATELLEPPPPLPPPLRWPASLPFSPPPFGLLLLLLLPVFVFGGLAARTGMEVAA